MNIIVIDDEPIIRQGIIHKIRFSGLPLKLVGEAGDGVAGLDLIRSERPSIVVTDIHMPAMNGLEFIRRAKELDPKLEFVILSGYDEFEYAKQAIRYGVNDYLLKPVENEDLSESLSRIVKKLEEDNHREQTYSGLKSLVETGREAVRRQSLTRWIEQGDSFADDEWRQLERMGDRFAAAVVLLEPFSLPHASFEAGEEKLLWFAIQNIVTERFEAKGIGGIFVRHSLREFELAYVYATSGERERSTIRSVLEEIIYGIRRYLRLDLTIGSGFYVDSASRIQESYRDAKQWARNAILHGNNRSYFSGRTGSKAPNRQSIISLEDEAMIAEWLKTWEAGKIHHWIERRVGAIVQDPESVYVQLEWFCVDLYLLFQKNLLAHSVNAEWAIGEMDDLQQWLQQLKDWREVSEQMKRLTNNVIGRLSETDGSSGKDIMEGIRIYIEHRYGEPLSLQSISDKFYIHPNYFSKRFKERFGMSFIDYLTSVRMREAAALLHNTELKVHQIAERVGFEDAAYFGSVFRKTFGVTPKQYRGPIA